MKKFVMGLVIGMLLVGCFSVVSANVGLFDMKYHFDQAIIVIGREPKVVDIKKWWEWDSGERQVETKDGTVYYGSLNNIILVQN